MSEEKKAVSDSLNQKPVEPEPMDSPRAVSFKLITADFESINLNENSQVYLFLIKRVSDNN
ncbi:hypothetical protein myaer102_47720 [Microcystis viridis NIES-102]|uniref:Uncharacterized protein n=1 Tax=Microcystis viridis NIES-102 TaxID=213615 RepID=A0A3G9K7Q5_MICVR|nr:hypothetical protein myaer102_47720 [Microcystis viridis NIES-102]